jgi:hypothetical protein
LGKGGAKNPSFFAPLFKKVDMEPKILAFLLHFLKKWIWSQKS